MLLLAPARGWSRPTCLDTATLTVFVLNLTNAPALHVTVDGDVASDGVPCDGAGVTGYHDVLTCTGSGLVRCGQESDLRPGLWVHRLSLTVPGSPTQRQAQRLVLIGDAATPASNALVWTAYPRTFVVGTTDADELWNAFRAAAEYTRCNPGPALMVFSPDAFPGARDPQRIQLLPPAPSCTIGDRNTCKPDLTPNTCTLDGLPDGRTAGLCFTGDRIVVDALDHDARPGAVILSVDKCGRQVLRVYGSDNVFRGLVLEGSRKPTLTPPCQLDTVAFTGPAARRNRIEQSLVVGPTCGDAVSVDNGAGAPDDDGDADDEVVDSRITGAEDKGVKVDFGGVGLVARSCLHDNRNGGIQSTMGGTVAATGNVVQHNVAGSSQNGLSVMGSADRSALTTNGNVVRLSGGRGLSVSDNADATFQNDYVEDSQFSGAKIETTTVAPVDVQPTARFHGVALVCNRHENLTGSCSPSVGDVDAPCTTVDDCCTKPDGTIDATCVSASSCTPGSFPRGFGVAISGAPDHLAPAAFFGDSLQPGRNAFTTNKNAPAGANFRVDGVEPLAARGNQWQHCGTGSVCDVATVSAQDLSASDGVVDLGIPPGPRAGALVVSHVAPARPAAGQIVRVYGDDFNAIEGNPIDAGDAMPNCSEIVACAPDGSCPTGPCVDGVCPCSIENPLVQQRNMQTGANRLRIKTKAGAVLATIYPDAVTPTMLAFRMPFDCFAPLTLEVAKRDPSGNRIYATTPLCDPSGCADLPAGAPCDDGNACTVDDRCDGAGGCVGGDALQCDGPCLVCDSASGCVPQPATARCDDGDACTAADHCSGVSNSCVPGRPVVCGGQCQTGQCDSLVGCLPEPADAPCSNGDACTVGDHCAGEGNVCVPGTARDCTGQCLTGACDSQTGCVPKTAGTVCRAATGVCDVAEVCDGRNATCPADGVAPTTLVCRPAVDACDLDDTCTGTATACPTFDHVKTGFDAVTCAFERSIAPASCLGVSIPRKVTRLFARAGKQVAAPSSSLRTAKSRLCGAERKLARALTLVDGAKHRHRHPLPETCAADVRTVIADAARRVAGTVSCGTRGLGGQLRE